MFKKFGYTESDFADSEGTTPLSGFRIHSTSDSENKSKEFETLKELRESEWTVEYEWTQRLTDGTMLFEGSPPEVNR